MIPTFGFAVRSSRREFNITAEKLATEVGVVRTYISKIERQNLFPSFEIAVKLAEVLGKDILRLYILEKFPTIKRISIELKSGKTFKYKF